MQKRKKEKQPFVDDGRVIAKMNVDGMPWYSKSSIPSEASMTQKGEVPLKMNTKEKMAFLKGVLGAAFLVAFLFIAVFGLFILFCCYVWFAH